MATELYGRSFVVDMGQAYWEDLPRRLRELGGRIWSVERGVTVVVVRVAFRKLMRPYDLQKKLWEYWPMCSIGVEASCTPRRKKR